MPSDLDVVDVVTIDEGTELDRLEVRAVERADVDGRGALADVEIRASRLVGVSLTGAAFERLRLVDVILEDCELSGVTLTSARMERVELRTCRASGLVAPDLVASSSGHRTAGWTRPT